MNARRNTVGRQLVVDALISQRDLQQIGNHASSRGTPTKFCRSGAGQRRSKVIGKLGFSSSSGTVATPGVSPKFWKRSARRLSASTAFIGLALYQRPPGCTT